MTKKELLVHLDENPALLMGTVRPSFNRQLDMWDINGQKYMVTTSRHWSSGTTNPGELVRRTYYEGDVVRIELLTELI